MQLACAVTTAPRDGADYLPRTLASLKAAGIERPVVVAEPDSPVPYDCPEVMRHAKRRGCYPNFRAALAYLLDARPEAEGLLVFQDDVDVSPGLSGWLERTPWPSEPRQIGALSLYTQASMDDGSDGWREVTEVEGKKFGGALAVVMPKHAARKLVNRPTRPECLTQIGFALGEFCREHHLECWRHAPSFVKHTGGISAISKRNNVVETESIRRHRQCGRFVTDAETMQYENCAGLSGDRRA